MKRLLDSMKRVWRHQSITTKFGIGISLLFLVMLVVALTGYLSLYYVKTVEESISTSKEIQQLVLEMDRGMGKSRHLHGGFFLHYPRIGLKKAHEIYAQPAVLEIARVVSASEKLGKKIEQLQVNDTVHKTNVDFNLYLSSAKRFADTSIESFELVTRLATPETGLEALMEKELDGLKTGLLSAVGLFNRYHDVEHLIERYLLRRKRHLMQSAFNNAFILRNEIEKDQSLTDGQKKDVLSRLNRIRILGDQILEVDKDVDTKFKDFFYRKIWCGRFPIGSSTRQDRM